MTDRIGSRAVAGELAGDDVAREGIAVGLETFVAEHYPRLIRLAGLVTRDVDDAQDAVQAALERAWRSRESLVDPARLRPWLDRIVVREAIRIGRPGGGLMALLRMRPDVREIEMASRQGQAGRAPAEVVSLRVAYDHLSAEHRAVVALHLYAGYSVAETAGFLRIPHDTVRSRLRAARERLRREMSEVA